MAEPIQRANFGRMPSGAEVDAFTLRNHQGMEAQIITYGGIVTRLTASDRHGRFADVVLGHDTLAEYLANNQYFGGLIGRYANRIARGAFTLDGKNHRLAINSGTNSMHGGVFGFDRVIWKAIETVVTSAGPQLTLKYVSRDGEEGYPGTLSVNAIYTLTDDNSLRLDFIATTDKPTVVNLTQHSYFNLCGSGNVHGHVLQINADLFAPLDETQIPTGELRSVTNSPFDFRRPRAIGDRIKAADEQIQFANGYDHHWVVQKSPGDLALMASVREPSSGRQLNVISGEPGLQFYSGNSLDGSITGKGGWTYTSRSGFCMEPQHFPDSPNQAAFPSTVLRPRDTYRNTIIYGFSAH
jgi:aldose 1-epimerase